MAGCIHHWSCMEKIVLTTVIEWMCALYNISYLNCTLVFELMGLIVLFIEIEVTGKWWIDSPYLVLHAEEKKKWLLKIWQHIDREDTTNLELLQYPLY